MPSRFEVQHLDIVDDLLDEDWMMETVVRQGWTLALVFGVGQSDEDATEKTKFRHGEAHLKTWMTSWIDHPTSTRLETCNVQRHGRVG
jgi:hypothetical protein